MEPVSTFAEVAWILRAGEVFAAYDYDLLPTVYGEVEQAFVTFMARVRQLRRAHAFPPGIQEWEKSEHLRCLQASRISGTLRSCRTTPSRARRSAGWASP
jgi:hypothetical protein